MPLNRYLTPGRTKLLHGDTREQALEALTDAACREEPRLDRVKVLELLGEREAVVSSRIAPGVALPHALIPGYNRQTLAIGFSPAGVPWDSPQGPRVNLVGLSLSGETQAAEHIRMLADLARTLRDPDVLESLSTATSDREIYDILLGRQQEATVATDARKERFSRSLLDHAAALVRESHASALMVLADEELSLEFLTPPPPDVPLILAANDAKVRSLQGTATFGAVLTVPFSGLARTHRVKLAFLFALSHGLIDKGDTVACLSGEPGSGRLHALEIVDVAEEFHVLLSLRAQLQKSDINNHVLDRVLHIAAALAREGREGQPVGALFVLGDYENVRVHCHQLVMNPFRGYPENERNILDPSLEETIKEFSRIDGAFLIRGDGVIMSLGSYIQSEDVPPLLESGLGARHAAGLAVTISSRALSIVISESTHRVSLFKQGRLVLALEQAAH